MHFIFLARENAPFTLRERISKDFTFSMQITFKNGDKTSRFKYHINIKGSTGNPTSKVSFKEVDLKILEKVSGKFDTFVNNFMLFSYNKVIYTLYFNENSWGKMFILKHFKM